MKFLIPGIGLRKLWQSGLVVAGAGLGCLAGMNGCIVVQDRPPVTYEPAPIPAPEPEMVEQPVYTPPPPEVVTVYEQDLSPYGHWVQTFAYGRCWVYDGRPYGWQPYTIGHWINTEDGWCWVAEGDEVAWGPTCYHYGRWTEDSSYGWVWVPGSVWGPSWCAWREGDGYSAWAPLPPECGDGQRFDGAYVDRYVPPERYVCVETRYIGEPRVYDHVERNNVTIINRTTNITNITYVNNRVVNRGVAVEHVQQAGGRNVEVVRTERAATAAEARRLVAEGKPVQYAPLAIQTYRSAHPIVQKAAPALSRAGVEKPLTAQHPAGQGKYGPQPKDRPAPPREPRSPIYEPRYQPQPAPKAERPYAADEPRETRKIPPGRMTGSSIEPRSADERTAGRPAGKPEPQPKAKPEPKAKPKPGEKPEDSKSN